MLCLSSKLVVNENHMDSSPTFLQEIPSLHPMSRYNTAWSNKPIAPIKHLIVKNTSETPLGLCPWWHFLTLIRSTHLLNILGQFILLAKIPLSLKHKLISDWFIKSPHLCNFSPALSIATQLFKSPVKTSILLVGLKVKIHQLVYGPQI